MALHLLNHSLADHVVTRLRDRGTPPAEFRALCHHVSLLLALEATRDLGVSDVTIETPLESCRGRALTQGLVVVPILRAGLGMVEMIADFFPHVSIGYIGLERDHTTAVARSYYCKLPPLTGARVLVVDPMLATGGSAIQALDVIRAQGGVDLRLLNIVAAPEGVKAVQEAHPEIPIYAAALDRQLNEKKYILPGLGDFGDRLYGT